MIVLIVDSPSMMSRTILETLLTINEKIGVVVVSASDKDELPKDYVVDDFIKIQQEFLIRIFSDAELTQCSYEYLDLELPVKYFVKNTSPVGVNIANVHVFNPSTPIRGTPIVH